MSILIYRNRLNGEMKAFGKFAKNLAINDYKIFYGDKKESFYELCDTHSTIIIITHGDKANLFHKFDWINGHHQVLFSESNLEKLKNKNIFAISCGTSCILGREAIKKGVNVYLGMKKSIHFDKRNKQLTVYPHHDYAIILKGIYRDIFKLGIEKAIKEKKSFLWLKLYLEKNLVKRVQIDMAITKQKREEYFYKTGLQNILIATSHVAANIELLGNEEAILN